MLFCKAKEEKITKRKLFALVMVLCMTFCSLTVPAFAAVTDVEATVSGKTETYISYELNGVLKRTITEEGTVIVTWKSFDGSENHTVINKEGILYLDGEIVSNFNWQVPQEIISANISEIMATGDIAWGKWNTFSEDVRTGGKSAAEITGLLAAAVPWVLVGKILEVVQIIQENYDFVRVKGKIRYGDDGKYFHYERYTNLYGDGKDALWSTDQFSTGREPL